MLSFTSPYTSCNDCYIVPSNSACADPELVGGGGGGSCMLLQHLALLALVLVLTCAPCTCPTLSLLSTRANTPLGTYSGSHWLKLYIGGGIFPQPWTQITPLVHMVVSTTVTHIGGGVNSTYWRRYCTCTQATYTVWWCFSVCVCEP